MANFDTLLTRKLNRNRGVATGSERSVTGTLVVNVGDSIVTGGADVIRAIPMGENSRPVRVILTATPISGTPVLVNPTFHIGVLPIVAGASYTDARNNVYPAITANTSIISATVVLSTDNMKQDVEVARPVADAVSNYAPFFLTLTPSGAGAFSVTGGSIELSLTVVQLGDEITSSVYTSYIEQKVKN